MKTKNQTAGRKAAPSRLDLKRAMAMLMAAGIVTVGHNTEASQYVRKGGLIIPNANLGVLEDTGIGYKAGQIYLANDARYLDTYYSIPLTTFAVGWRDPNNIEETLNFFAPPVETARRFEWKKATNAEEFLSETDDIRAIGADFKTVDFQGTDVTDRTLNKGLTYIADLDNVRGGDWQNQKVAKLMRRLFRNELRRAIAAASAAATNTAKTWDSTAGKDPDMDIITELVTAATASGVRPNRIAYGDTAWSKRQLSLRAQNLAGQATSSTMSMEQLAAVLGVDKCMVSKERYQSSPTAKTEVVNNLVLMFYAEDGADLEDPSNIKRFYSTFSGEQGGGRVRVYVQQISSKLVAITVEHYSKVVATSTLGVRQFTVS